MYQFGKQQSVAPNGMETLAYRCLSAEIPLPSWQNWLPTVDNPLLPDQVSTSLESSSAFSDLPTAIAGIVEWVADAPVDAVQSMGTAWHILISSAKLFLFISSDWIWLTSADQFFNASCLLLLTHYTLTFVVDYRWDFYQNIINN